MPYYIVHKSLTTKKYTKEKIIIDQFGHIISYIKNIDIKNLKIKEENKLNEKLDYLSIFFNFRKNYKIHQNEYVDDKYIIKKKDCYLIHKDAIKNISSLNIKLQFNRYIFNILNNLKSYKKLVKDTIGTTAININIKIYQKYFNIYTDYFIIIPNHKIKNVSPLAATQITKDDLEVHYANMLDLGGYVNYAEVEILKGKYKHFKYDFIVNTDFNNPLNITDKQTFNPDVFNDMVNTIADINYKVRMDKINSLI